MAGALRKTMVYLGLAEDDERYDDELYEEYDDDARAAVPRCRAARARPGHPAAARARWPGCVPGPAAATCTGSPRSTRAPTTRPRPSASPSARACR